MGFPSASSASGERRPAADRVQNGASALFRDRYRRELLGRNVVRLGITYLAPLILLTIYFHVQYRELWREGRLQHLSSVAEHRANSLDLFLRERVVNLENLVDDPKLSLPPSSAHLEAALRRLRRDSGTFVDIGFVDASGVLRAYAGPFPSLEQRRYGNEAWFLALDAGGESHVITDSYLGFRNRPHLTIAVVRTVADVPVRLKAALDPEEIYRQISSSTGSENLDVSIVNHEGRYQLVPAHLGRTLEASSLAPPRDPPLGISQGEGGKGAFAYAWLQTAPWAVVVQGAASPPGLALGNPGGRITLLGLSIALILVVLSVIVIRAKKLVDLQIEKELTQAQFEHAARLASIGELSAGIAHEINNPLAIVSEEAGLVRDLMNAEFKQDATFADLRPHLDNIQEAVFRCRDVTRKLLSFVRKTDIQLKPHDVNELLDELIDGFWLREMAVSNIEIVKRYAPERLELVTDANQIKQVLLNILNNAADAIRPPGRITITTTRAAEGISVGIADTGKGIGQEEMGRIFMPFFTTKEVGEGTGLGLSVSLGIVRSLGGRILVESLPGKGSVFTVLFPTGPPGSAPGVATGST